MSADGWDDILDPGEEILWQGQPSSRFTFRPANLFPLLFGIAFAGFALFWMILASQAGGLFWMFGLIHFFAGVGVAIGPTFKPAFTAKRTWYTLTSKRAIIAKKSIFGQKSLASYPITPDTPITQLTHTFDLGSIHFATRTRRSNNRNRQVEFGFENIENTNDVMRHMRAIQKDPS